MIRRFQLQPCWVLPFHLIGDRALARDAVIGVDDASRLEGGFCVAGHFCREVVDYRDEFLGSDLHLAFGIGDFHSVPCFIDSAIYFLSDE